MNLATHIQKCSSLIQGMLLKSIIATVLFMSSHAMMAQDCNSILACNDLVQVSLGDNCTETIVPDMILEGQQYPNNFYDVVVKTANGTVITNDIVNKNHIGKTYQVLITLNGCDLSCWGYITVEDKLPPVITNCPDVTIDCGQSTAPGSVPRPSAADACSTVTLTSSDKEVISQCSDTYVKVITRTWTATDSYGNKTTCAQTINVVRPTIEDISFPLNYDGSTGNNPAFECGSVSKLLPNGAPHPDVTGFPDGVTCPNLMYFYEDIIFTICGNSKKVLRQWTVIDWCTGRDTVGVQVIKIHDTQPPLCVSDIADFQVVAGTDEGKCTGTWTVPAPNVIYECSQWDYVVGYKLKDDKGIPGAEFVFDSNVEKTVRSDGSYFYKIKNLPADTSWIQYVITDACGNSSICNREIVIKDDEAPTPVCEGFTVVTLKENGWADAYAETFDDHSSDNCGIVKFEVKRLENKCATPADLNFRDNINFCCADVSNDPTVYQKVVLRAYDAAGNFADCVANVKVQDKKPPVITPPPAITIDCGVDHKNTANTGGMATATDACTVTVTFTDAGSLTCGQGTITRTWRATDNQGNSVTATQKIVIQDSDPFGAEDITWPSDLEINGCKQEDAHPDLLNSRPFYVNHDCADIAVSYADTLFSVPGACLKIIRTWRVVNWCTVNTQNPNYIIHKQKITLKNSTSPTFVTGCTNRTINSPENDCEEYVEHSVTATDDCTPASQLKYTWEYDEDSDGDIDQTGTGSFYARVYPAGKHKMTFRVVDLCLNASSCSYTFQIKDNKPPTPICHNQLVWVLDNQGKAEVWASDFNLKSQDFCDGDNLKFSFNAAGNQPGKNFTCADVPNGKEALIPLKMYVIDTDGNSEFCDVVLRLQDSPATNACADQNLTATVSGKVINKQIEAIEKIEVQMDDMNTNVSQKSTTTEEGLFTFSDIPTNNQYAVHPRRTDDVLNGVSTLDLVMIQRHILNIKKFDNPYDLLAADANNDKRVTASDLVNIRKVLLGSQAQFSNNDAWRFLPANYVFADPQQPFEAPRSIELLELNGNVENADFISIKIGDVNNSATYNIQSQKSENRSEPISLIVENIHFQAGDIISVPVKIGTDIIASGAQFEINFDHSALDLVDLSSGVLTIDDDFVYATEGSIKISIVQKENKLASEGNDLLYVSFMAKTDGDLSTLSLNEQFQNEVYDEKLQTRKLNLSLKGNEETKPLDQVVHNYPNPFRDETLVSYFSVNGGKIKLTLTDISGKAMMVKQYEAVSGWNKFRITKEDVKNKSGVYIYQVENNGTLSTGRMILCE